MKREKKKINDFDCKICGKEFKGQISLGIHLSKHHKIDSIVYYDTYIKSENEGLCENCGRPTKFDRNLHRYRKYCTRKCSAEKRENYEGSNKFWFKKGEPSFNKGKKMSTSQWEKLKNSGTWFTKEKISGNNNPMRNPMYVEKFKVSKRKFLNSEKGVVFRQNASNNLRELLKQPGCSLQKSFIPAYNKIACIYFDLLNNYNNWNGYHALNGGEFYIKELGYWVDYYEPNLNLVIEWDEPGHYIDGILKNSDIERQIKIVEHLNCTFVRINEKNFLKNYTDNAITTYNGTI